MKKLFLLFFALSSGQIHAAERWWEVRIADQPSGYLHTFSDNLTDGAISTTDEQVVVINRMGSKVEIKAKVTSVEDATGELISVREETSSSQQAVVIEAVREGSNMILQSTTGGATYNRSIPIDGQTCGPQAIIRLSGEKLKNAGDTFSCQSFQPSLGFFKLTRTVLGKVSVDGQSLLKVKSELENTPNTVEELLDADGISIRSEREMPFGRMVIRITDRDTALQASLGGELPEESYNRTLARSNIRFADARSVDYIRLKITHRKPEIGWPKLEGSNQKIIEKTPSTVILEVERPQPKAVEEKVDGETFLVPNQYLQSDDPEIIQLARKITGSEQDKLKAARLLQDWVAANLKFDVGVAVAPASEVVRNRRGTCFAYSVLLASLGRAVGIPSRMAMGYVYAQGIWGGHAWVEFLIDGQWLPLDAAAYRPGLADAARFQFDTYTFEDNGATFNLAGLQLYGNINVEVLEYSSGGEKISVPDSATPYTVEGNEYRNIWLGFSIRKPEEYDFVDLDAVYPDNTVLRMAHDDEKLTISLNMAGADPDSTIRKRLAEVSETVQKGIVKLDGQLAEVASSDSKARLTLRKGEAIWMITAEGRNANHLLDQIAGEWKWITPY